MEKDLHDMNSSNSESDLFPHLEIGWKRTKDDVWKQMAGSMQHQVISPPTKTPWLRIAAAAVLILSLSIGMLMRMHTTTYLAAVGQKKQVELPDGSIAWLNAGSSVSFQPYWWWQQREVDFSGEAYFEVAKGKAFTVHSETGSTTVLGTSFTVFARQEDYSVACFTGRVKVQAASTQHSIILHPSETATLRSNGQLEHTKKAKVKERNAWIRNEMIFTSLSLSKVFAEVERQYGIRIETGEELNLQYTGSFKTDNTPSEALLYICKPFGLHVKKVGASKFRVVRMTK